MNWASEWRVIGKGFMALVCRRLVIVDPLEALGYLPQHWDQETHDSLNLCAMAAWKQRVDQLQPPPAVVCLQLVSAKEVAHG